MRASSTGLPFLLPPEAGLVSPSAGVSLWLLSPRAVDAQKGLPHGTAPPPPSPLLLLLLCSRFRGQGYSSGWTQGPEAGLHPKARQTEPTLFLFSFSPGGGGGGGYWILLPTKSK